MLMHTCYSLSKFGKLQQIAAMYGYAYHMCKSADLKCICVCYIAPSSSTVNAGNYPYDLLQNDVVDAQNAGGCIIVCGDMNARTAEQDDYTRFADLQNFVDVSEEGAYLGADVPQRCSCDKAPSAGTWGGELLELCRSTELLIVIGRTLGSHRGLYLYQPSGAKCGGVSAQHLSSVTDMRVMRDAQYCNFSCDMPHDSEKDHFPLQLDLSCSMSTPHFIDEHDAPKTV